MRRRVLRLVLGAVLAPALVIGTLQWVIESRAADSQQKDQLRLAAKLTATSIDQFVQAHASAVTLAASNATAYGEPPDLVGLKALFPQFVTVLATAADGRIIGVEPAGRARRSIGRSVADRDYFQAPARTRRPYISNAFQGRGMGTDALVAVSAPLLRNGQFDGIVEGSIKVDAFTALRSAALRARGHEMLVVDRTGYVIHASAGLPFHFRQYVGDHPVLASAPGDADLGPVMLDAVTLRRGETWVAVAKLGSGWRVALFAPRSIAQAAVWRRIAGSISILGLVSLLVLLTARVEMRRIGAAVSAVLEELRSIASGQRAARSPMRDVPVELQPIADEVVGLASRLQEANAELESALAGQQALAESLREANERQDEIIRLRTAQLERANSDLERVSRTDALTGAQNVRGMHANVARFTDEFGRLQQSAGVIMFDVDHFKRFNDTFGHPAGDHVLRRVAAAATAALRGEPDDLARVGGEEFLVFLPNADVNIAQHVAERIRCNIYDLGIPAPDGVDERVTVSVGIATGLPGDALDELVRHADAALYRAKSTGRNRWHA